MALPLLAVPNVAEGREATDIDALQRAFTRGAKLLDRHSDADHDRTVFTLAGEPASLREALLAGAQQAIETIDMSTYDGLHPAVGALDVCPLVWADPDLQPAARIEAVEVAEQVGGLGVPVFLYGELASRPEHAERAYFRNGGLAELWLRMEGGGLHPDFGPRLPHPTAGVTLITARPPLAAFNVELDSDDVELARAVAAGLRESGGGPPGVRAIGLPLSSGRTQVSTNVHNPFVVPLAEVVARVRALAQPLGAKPVEAEVIGLVPEAALADYPSDVPIRDLAAARPTIESRLAGAP
ncbi:MAG: glutamate formiminotransferase / 5-formyltetrahydrofolate cyclo-ligase [Solirubrobacterales bacterium]|nr:glutamate formiminotransferase / 5-formyltetrahydrofolate cyclo-ligase [Solirubrobacterales bacterium]